MKQKYDKIHSIRKKIEDINWIKDRIDIFYNRYPIFKNSKCKIEYISKSSSEDKYKLGEYRCDEFDNKKIYIFLDNISDHLSNRFIWEDYKDIIKEIRKIVLHEYRHYLQIEKLYELNILYTIPDCYQYKWIIDLLEEDANNYAKHYLDYKEELDLNSLITKIVVEDKVNLKISKY